MQKLKIIFQKRIFPLVTVFIVVLSAFSVSSFKVSGATLDYNDYISSIVVDGDNDIVTVDFPVDDAIVQVQVNGVVLGTFPIGTIDFSQWNYSSYNLLTVCFGDNSLLLSNIPDGTVFECSVGFDANGAYSTPDSLYQFLYRKSDGTAVSEVNVYGGLTPIVPFTFTHEIQHPIGAEKLTVQAWFTNFAPANSDNQAVTFFYKYSRLTMSISSLYRLQQEVGETNEILEAVKVELIEQGTTLDSVLQKLGVIEANQLDILSILRTISADLYQWSARIWIDLNDGFDSVVEAISDGLSSGLDTLNNNVQNIITGGENGSELDAGTNEMEQANDKLNGVVDKFDQANEAKPTVPDDITTLIDPVQIDESVTFITSVFNYEAMGLDVLYPVLGLVAILAVLFYVLFGKAG